MQGAAAWRAGHIIIFHGKPDVEADCIFFKTFLLCYTVSSFVLKDFSRFGRDYVELGNYLEQLFPFMGVRFISVNDNYDSAELSEGATGGLDVAFKNLIYDYYYFIF